MEPSVPFEKHHFEFLSDPERARAYLEVALEEYARDHDRSALLLALKDVATAQGGLGRLARAKQRSAIGSQQAGEPEPSPCIQDAFRKGQSSSGHDGENTEQPRVQAIDRTAGKGVMRSVQLSVVSGQFKTRKTTVRRLRRGVEVSETARCGRDARAPR
jgi:DNA-binding phage protein